MAVLSYLVARLKEASTWAGVAPILLAIGVPAGTVPLIVQVGMALAGAAAILIPSS